MSLKVPEINVYYMQHGNYVAAKVNKCENVLKFITTPATSHVELTKQKQTVLLRYHTLFTINLETRYTLNTDPRTPAIM